MRKILRRIEPLRQLNRKWHLRLPYLMSYLTPEKRANLAEQRFIRQHRFRKHPRFDDCLFSATKRLIERYGLVVLAGLFKGIL